MGYVLFAIKLPLKPLIKFRMSLNNLLKTRLSEHIATAQLIETLFPSIIEAATKIVVCYKQNNKILLAGNGGSAADAQHWAAEWVIRFNPKVVRKSLPALALTTDTSMLTAGANDLGYDAVLERCLEGLGRSGDVLILISTSGNSPNLIRAAVQAKRMDIYVIGVLGRDGGKLAPLCDLSLIVPATDTARIQEMHSFIGHMLCEISENLFIKDE